MILAIFCPQNIVLQYKFIYKILLNYLIQDISIIVSRWWLRQYNDDIIVKLLHSGDMAEAPVDQNLLLEFLEPYENEMGSMEVGIDIDGNAITVNDVLSNLAANSRRFQELKDFGCIDQVTIYEIGHVFPSERDLRLLADLDGSKGIRVPKDVLQSEMAMDGHFIFQLQEEYKRLGNSYRELKKRKEKIERIIIPKLRGIVDECSINMIYLDSKNFVVEKSFELLKHFVVDAILHEKKLPDPKDILSNFDIGESSDLADEVLSLVNDRIDIRFHNDMFLSHLRSEFEDGEKEARSWNFTVEVYSEFSSYIENVFYSLGEEFHYEEYTGLVTVNSDISMNKQYSIKEARKSLRRYLLPNAVDSDLINSMPQKKLISVVNILDHLNLTADRIEKELRGLFGLSQLISDRMHKPLILVEKKMKHLESERDKIEAITGDHQMNVRWNRKLLHQYDQDPSKTVIEIYNFFKYCVDSYTTRHLNDSSDSKMAFDVIQLRQAES